MRRLSRIYLIIGILVGTGLFLYGLKYPTHLYSPNDLAKAHDKIVECKECHKPFLGVPSSTCLNNQCHSMSKITESQKVTGGLHAQVKGEDCMLCHTEHKGVSGPITVKFEHDLLGAGLERCMECHKGPPDELHRDIGECQECHTTEKWSPATFEHERYFPITGDHKASCTKCHEGKNFKKYTCLNCHEHDTVEIRSEHSEEGIKDYGECLRCHSFVMDGRRYGIAKVEIEEDDSD